MKKLLLSISLLFLSCISNSQTTEWTISGGGLNDDLISNIVFNQNGNIYNLLNEQSSPGHNQPFIEKHDLNGALVWKQQLSDLILPYSFLKTYQNSLLLIAEVSDSIATDIGIIHNGMYGLFFDFNGNLISYHSINLQMPCYNCNGPRYNDFSIDGSGQLYVAGTYSEHPLIPETNGEDGNTILKTINYAQFFKFSSSFSVCKAISFQNKTFGAKVIAEKNGNTIYSMNGGNPDDPGFPLIKFDNNFDTLWSVSTPLLNHYLLNDMIEDERQNLFLMGTYNNTFNYENISFSNSNNIPGHFLLKLDPSGHIIWGQNIFSSLYLSNWQFSKVVNNHIYFSGVLVDSINIGNYNLEIPDTNFVLMCLDQNGNFLWEQHHKYSYDILFPYVAVDDNENVYFYGSFKNTLFSNNTPSNGGYDWYIIKMPGFNQVTDPINNKLTSVVFPNPCDEKIIIYPGKDFQILKNQFEMYDLQGKKIAPGITFYDSMVIMNTSNLANGIYELCLHDISGKLLNNKICVMHR